MMSAGSRSLVNWIRWNARPREVASACARVVLPTPGMSSINRWPRAIRQASESRICRSLPRMMLPTWAMTFSMCGEIMISCRVLSIMSFNSLSLPYIDGNSQGNFHTHHARVDRVEMRGEIELRGELQHALVAGEDLAVHPAHTSRARRVHEQSHEPFPESPALPLVRDDYRELAGQAALVHDVARHADLDFRAVALAYRDERHVTHVVHLDEVLQHARRELAHAVHEPVVAR